MLKEVRNRETVEKLLENAHTLSYSCSKKEEVKCGWKVNYKKE
jgi:hypothetical protein